MTTEPTHYRRRMTNLACRDGAVFLQPPASEKWLRLAGPGRRIWELLEYPTTATEIAAQVVSEFAGDRSSIQADVDGFLSLLLDRGLVDTHLAPPSPAQRQRQRYLGLLKRALMNLIYPEHELRIRFLEQQTEPLGKLDRTRYLRDIRYRDPAAYRAVIDAKQGLGQSRQAPYRYSHTMIGLSALDNLERCAEAVFRDRVPGDFLEAGVCQGGAAIFMRALQVAHGEGSRRLWVADSFQGLPPSTAEPDRQAGLDLSEPTIPWLAFSLEGVRDHFIRYGLLDDGVEFLPGWFEDTLAAAPVGPLAILRLDADLYSSTRVVLERLYPQVVPGGFVIIDDYGALSVCRQAVDEYRIEHGITEPLQFVNSLVVWWRKP